jgi:hypothetical protein
MSVISKTETDCGDTKKEKEDSEAKRQAMELQNALLSIKPELLGTHQYYRFLLHRIHANVCSTVSRHVGTGTAARFCFCCFHKTEAISLD